MHQRWKLVFLTSDRFVMVGGGGSKQYAFTMGVLTTQANCYRQPWVEWTIGSCGLGS